MTSLQLAKDLIKEKTVDGKCTLSKKKLGEILRERYPTFFPTNEAGRTTIRKVTGSSGELHRRKLKTRIEWNGFSLPEPEQNDYSKFVIRESRIGILSDIHFPYYHKAALTAAVSYLKKWKPECILLNGDIIDCYALSRWEKDPRKRGFKYELDVLKAFFAQLKDLFPKARIVFKLGNHEERYEKTILQRVPEFVDMEQFNFETIIEAKKYGIEVVANKRVIQVGKLNIIHGHELPHGLAAPVNPARGFFLKTKANTLGSHHHQISEHIEQDLNGNQIGAWSIGCLSELNPAYAPINKWQHGFATVENNKTDFTVRNLKIINGRVL